MPFKDIDPTKRLRNTGVATIALLSGFATAAVGVKSVPNRAESGDSIRPHVSRCLNEYARLDNNPNDLSAVALSARIMEIGVKAYDMHERDPSCDNAEVRRTTYARIIQNGLTEIGTTRLINTASDYGQINIGNVHTRMPIVCNAIEKIVLITEARSSQAVGTTVEGMQSFSVSTKCH